MAFTISDILHYWDYRSGSVEPIIGGAPNFSRAGNAFNAVRPALARESITDTPRIGHDGLRLELSQTNQVTDPFDLSTGNWTAQNGITVTGVTSYYDGKTGNLLTDATSSISSRVYQAIGTFTANPETVVYDIEEQDDNDHHVLIWDSSATQPQIYVILTWSTLSVDVTAGAATNKVGGIIELAETGPNGRKMVRVWATYTPVTLANARRIYVWSDEDAAGKSNIIHWVGVYESDTIIGSAVDGTRLTELFYWDSPPKPQAMVIYGEYEALMKDAATLNRVWAIENTGTNPRLLVHVTGTALRMFFNNNTTDGTKSAFVTINQEPGDIIKFVVVLNADSSGRIIAKNGSGSAGGADMLASASGLPNAWDSDAHVVNSRKNGVSKGALKMKQLKIVKLGNQDSALDGTGTGDEDIIKEMAGLVVTADGSTVRTVNI